jgi:uncharacterized membrane protein YbaN (DUF454 family)
MVQDCAVLLTFTKILFWRVVGLVALLLGLIGLLLPVVPTVPFLLVAAWAGSKGWPRLEQYLLSHKYFGPQIRNWREKGAISRGAKFLTTVMFCGSLLMIWLLPLHQHLQMGLSVFIAGALVWLWTRPSAP